MEGVGKGSHKDPLLWNKGHPGEVALARHPRTGEAEAGGSLSAQVTQSSLLGSVRSDLDSRV